MVNEAMPLFEGERVKRSIIRLQTIDKQLTEKLKVLRGFDFNTEDIENDVLEAEDIADKVLHLCGELR